MDAGLNYLYKRVPLQVVPESIDLMHNCEFMGSPTPTALAENVCWTAWWVNLSYIGLRHGSMNGFNADL